MSERKKEIAVVGAGFTGLTAAYRLSKAGHKVTVIEATPHVGGLVSSFTLKNGAHAEMVYHFLYKTDNHILDLVEELEISDKMAFHPSSIATFYDGVAYSFMTPMDLLKFKPLSFIAKVRTGLTALYLQRVRNWEKLTEVTAHEWLQKWNGQEAYKIIWEPLLRGKFDVYYDKVTMAWLWGRIKVRQDSKEKGEVSEKLGYFDHGGWNSLVVALDAAITKLGGNIVTDAPISSLSYDKDTDKTTLTYQDGEHAFDSVVFTTPSNVLAKIAGDEPTMTKEYLEKLGSIDYLAAITMVFTSEQKLSDFYWHQISDQDAPFLVLLDMTNLIGSTDAYDGKHLYYIGDYMQHESDIMKTDKDDIRDQWFTGLKKMFPEFDESQVDEAHVFKFGNAQHIVDVGFEDKIPAYKTPIPHTFLANFSQIYPEDRGTNYAVRDGNHIAELVEKDLA